MNFKNLDTAKEPNTITVFGVRLGGGGGGGGGRTSKYGVYLRDGVKYYSCLRDIKHFKLLSC